jgi:ferrous iron transport protein B
VPSLLDIFLTLVGFLPQVFLLYFGLFCITESGLLDLIAKKLSVQSKLLFSVLLGFCCTTLAVCSLDNIPDKKKRGRIAFFLSFIPCSAMLPLLILIISSVLKVSFFWVVFAYFASIFIGLALCLLFRRPPTDEPTPIINSVNNTQRGLHFQNFYRALKQSFNKTLTFTNKIAVAFIVSAFFITILARFTFEFKYTAEKENSILFYICGVLSPVFAPVGLDNPAIICALMFGVIAKESAVSVLLLFPEILSGLSFATGVSLIVFYIAYPVCTSCCLAIAMHCGKRIATKLFIFNLVTAYLFSFIIYNLCAIL